MFGNDDHDPGKPKYDHVVLFDKSGSNSSPFAVYPTSMFSEAELKRRWLDGILDSYSRKKNLTCLKSLPGNLCLFSKIESGMYYIIKNT